MKKLMVIGCASLLAMTASATIKLNKTGEKIAWLGDSITCESFGLKNHGFIHVCHKVFATNGLDVMNARAGIPGNTTRDMLKRMDMSVLNRQPTDADYMYAKDADKDLAAAKKRFPNTPTVLVVSGGVNDVGGMKYNDKGEYEKGGVLFPEFKENITKIVDMAQEKGIKVVLLTTTMYTENIDDRRNKTLVQYNDFIRLIARQKNCTLVDINAAMQKEVAEFRAKPKDNKDIKGNYRNRWLRDGLHPNLYGQREMGRLILKQAFGYTDEDIAKAGFAK